MPIARVLPVRPTFSRWTGAVATDPTAAGTEAEQNISVLDMGNVTAGANSEAKAISLEYAASFDDSAYKSRIWMIDQPSDNQKTWMLEASSTALFPATALTNPLTNGVAIPVRPNSVPKAATLYDTTANRLRNILIQLQTGATATVRNSATEHVSNPKIEIAVFRADPAVARLREDESPLDLFKGQLFTLGTVDLFMVEDGRCKYIGAIKDENKTFSLTQEIVEWKKFKPKATVHTALLECMGEIKFQLDEISPRFEATALSEGAYYDSNAEVIGVDYTGLYRPLFEREFYFRWQTQGMFEEIIYVPRGDMYMTGDRVPGGDDFSGVEFTIKPKIDSFSGRKLVRHTWSPVPVELSVLELTYQVS